MVQFQCLNHVLFFCLYFLCFINIYTWYAWINGHTAGSKQIKHNYKNKKKKKKRPTYPRWGGGGGGALLYTFENICQRACGKQLLYRCLHGDMLAISLLVNFIPDHATKHRHFIVSNLRKIVHLFLEYGEGPTLPILQITFRPTCQRYPVCTEGLFCHSYSSTNFLLTAAIPCYYGSQVFELAYLFQRFSIQSNMYWTIGLLPIFITLVFLPCIFMPYLPSLSFILSIMC